MGYKNQLMHPNQSVWIMTSCILLHNIVLVGVHNILLIIIVLCQFSGGMVPHPLSLNKSLSHDVAGDVFEL